MQPVMPVHLGRGQADARRRVHGLEHVGDLLLQGGIERRDGRGPGAQPRIGIFEDGELWPWPVDGLENAANVSPNVRSGLGIFQAAVTECTNLTQRAWRGDGKEFITAIAAVVALARLAPSAAKREEENGLESSSLRSVPPRRAVRLAGGCRGPVAGSRLPTLLGPGRGPLRPPRCPSPRRQLPPPRNRRTAIEAALPARRTGGAAAGGDRQPAPAVAEPSAPHELHGEARRHAVGHLGHVPARSLAVAGDLARESRRSRIRTSSIPGDVLTLAYDANGRPQVHGDAGSAVRVSAAGAQPPLEGPIATIPYDAIRAFLGRPSIVSKEDLTQRALRGRLRDGHMVAGAGNEVYVKGLEDVRPGRYTIVHVGEPLKDPETGKVLGYMGTYTGSGPRRRGRTR